MISATQRDARLATQLYEVRDAAKFLYGKAYGEVMHKVGKVIKARAEAQNKEILSTAIEIAKGLEGGEVLIIMAAAVELIEPSQGSGAAQ